mmetsp:Transcript_2788/g.8564  ORF Transcript_2788/g.8564 Transcript_2788/m.8564 type:complete len:171 (+) Transcript_2788:1943-2455(+)
MGQLGATSMSVMKAAVAAASFIVSILFFCNASCCVPDEQREGFSCPAHQERPSSSGWTMSVNVASLQPRASAFFCHYSPSQCFTFAKAASLALVLAGVLLYTRSGRLHLDAPPEVGMGRKCSQNENDNRDGPEGGAEEPDEEQASLIVAPRAKGDEAIQWRIATWRWLSR